MMNRLIMATAASAFCLVGSAQAFAEGQPAGEMRGLRSIVRLCAMDQQWTTRRLAERLARRLNVTDQQKPALQELQEAIVKARSDAKSALCDGMPDLSSLPKRLAFAQKRLQLRLDGLRAVQPKLEAFYAALNGEQQAELNHLWRHRMGWRGGESGWPRGMRRQDGGEGWRRGWGAWRDRGGVDGGQDRQGGDGMRPEADDED
jgi:LTXXQ motif family protein